MTAPYGTGYQSLWGWFGLSRASFLVLPRVMMHEMPDQWQERMADLLLEWEKQYPNADLEFTVRKSRGGKLQPMPEILTNYRHPDRDAVRSIGDAS